MPLDPAAKALMEQIEAAGGARLDVRLQRYDGLIHGFVSMAAVLPRAEEVLREAGESLRGLLARA